jgi:hypothetical protein
VSGYGERLAGVFMEITKNHEGNALPGVEDMEDAEELDTSGLDMDYEPIDVYDAEGELDAGAIRAEVDRLLRRMNVPPERIELTILLDEWPRP